MQIDYTNQHLTSSADKIQIQASMSQHSACKLAGLEESIAEATKQTAGASLLTLAVCGFQAGQRALAEAYVRSFLMSYGASSSSEDRCLAASYLAMSCFERNGPDSALKVSGCWEAFQA